MAIAEFTTGTKSVDTNEWSMADTSTANGEAFSTATPLTTDGIFQLWLDLSDMVAADVLQIRVYEKCRSGDTQRIAAEWILRDAQSTPIWVSPSLILLHGWDMTADCIAGTSITVNWSIRQVA
jgi:hypothetical protein